MFVLLEFWFNFDARLLDLIMSNEQVRVNQFDDYFLPVNTHNLYIEECGIPSWKIVYLLITYRLFHLRSPTAHLFTIRDIEQKLVLS